jgi:hypothetical protein
VRGSGSHCRKRPGLGSTVPRVAEAHSLGSFVRDESSRDASREASHSFETVALRSAHLRSEAEFLPTQVAVAQLLQPVPIGHPRFIRSCKIVWHGCKQGSAVVSISIWECWEQAAALVNRDRQTGWNWSTVTGESTSPGEDSMRASAEREGRFDPQSKAEPAKGEYKGARGGTGTTARHCRTAQLWGGPGGLLRTQRTTQSSWMCSFDGI